MLANAIRPRFSKSLSHAKSAMRALAASGAAAAALLVPSSGASADTLVLVQGYLGSAGSWRASGIAPLLHQRGWVDAGHLYFAPDWRIRSTVASLAASSRWATEPSRSKWRWPGDPAMKKRALAGSLASNLPWQC